ncbi:hypothetical protein C8R46DRAFT_1207933 [Mycena filopes]|nr:hypothetical protein C8R46DRAFT_1207933 [Mycena filopes]
MNPYAQGGWSNNNNQSSWGTTTPSLYGALPYPTPIAPEFISFTFSPVDNGTILDCLVIGPQSRTYFRVNTASGFTVVSSSSTEGVALIEWRQHTYPMVEVRDIVSRRGSAQWLALAPDRVYRVMSARGRSFRWRPSESYIELYSTNVPNPHIYGRILQGEGGNTRLDLTSEAIQLGLLEVGVTCTLLLLSGRNID